jgi:hypothetical protein
MGGAGPTSGADDRIDPGSALWFLPDESRRAKFTDFYTGVACPAPGCVDDGHNGTGSFPGPAQPSRCPGGGSLSGYLWIQRRITPEDPGALGFQPAPG